MLRDTLKDKKYFDERVNFRAKVIDKKIQKITLNNKLTSEVKMKNAFRLNSDIIYLLQQKFARGDNLTELKPHLLEALEYRQWQKDYADALPANEQKDRIGWEEIRTDYLENWLDWLAFAYCLDMGDSYYTQALELIANQGLDVLFDSIALKMGDVERPISDKLLFKKRFTKLYDVIIAEPDQQPSLMKAYLDAWYELIDSPDYHLMDTDAYIGYWSWEAALVVKLYNIDDSSFIDHPYYPKDLVHFKG